MSWSFTLKIDVAGARVRGLELRRSGTGAVESQRDLGFARAVIDWQPVLLKDRLDDLARPACRFNNLLSLGGDDHGGVVHVGHVRRDVRHRRQMLGELAAGRCRVFKSHNACLDEFPMYLVEGIENDNGEQQVSLGVAW